MLGNGEDKPISGGLSRNVLEWRYRRRIVGQKSFSEEILTSNTGLLKAIDDDGNAKNEFHNF